MDNGNFESIKIALDKKEEIDKAKNSYISKDKLIEMLNSLDFIAVKDIRISVITGFICNGINDVDTLGYDISID